jgi:hypothetical protein
MENAQSLFSYKKHKMQIPSDLSMFHPLRIAAWQGSYFIIYTDNNYTGHLLKTSNFEKYELIAQYPNTTIWDIETKGGEIALLTSPAIIFKSSKNTNAIYFTKIDSKGKILQSNKLLGDADWNQFNAYTLARHANFHLIWANDHYVAYFTILHNWAKKETDPADVHQAHTQVFFFKNGERINDWRGYPWLVSHTFGIEVAFSENYILKVAKGDANPRGIHYNIISRKMSRDPEDPEDLDYYLEMDASGEPMLVSGIKGDNFVDLVLGDPQIDEKNQKIYISGTTRDKRASADIFLIIQDFDEKQSPQTIWLTNSPTVEEHSVRLFPFGPDNFLLLWQEYDLNSKLIENWEDEILDDESYTDAENTQRLFDEIQKLQCRKAVLIDKKGKFLGSPQKVDLSLPCVLGGISAPDDHFANALLGQELQKSYFEPKRIILPAYIEEQKELIFYEIFRP